MAHGCAATSLQLELPARFSRFWPTARHHDTCHSSATALRSPHDERSSHKHFSAPTLDYSRIPLSDIADLGSRTSNLLGVRRKSFARPLATASPAESDSATALASLAEAGLASAGSTDSPRWPRRAGNPSRPIRLAIRHRFQTD